MELAEMGGSGGSGTFSSNKMMEIQKAADERLRQMASQTTKILFVCEVQDQEALLARIESSDVFSPERTILLTSNLPELADEAVSSATFLVTFTDKVASAPFIDKVTDMAMVKKMGGVHVQHHPEAIIPSKISAYRWRSISWNQLVEIFR